MMACYDGCRGCGGNGSYKVTGSSGTHFYQHEERGMQYSEQDTTYNSSSAGADSYGSY